MTISINPIPIWLDCDTGHDDAVAILLAACSPYFNLLGVSASYGNAPIECTVENTLSILTAIGKYKDVNVYEGAARPWVQAPKFAQDIHGLSGLDGSALLPVPQIKASSGNYKTAIKDAILKNKGKISMVSIGPLTTIATVLKEYPYLKEHIKYISIMGGGFEEGNRNANGSAEFNFWLDADAARYVLTDPEINYKCILATLDLTHKAIATKDIQKQILGTGSSKVRNLYHELFLFFAATYKTTQGFDYGPPVHDPLALITLLHFYGMASEEIDLRYSRMDVEVITETNDDEGKVYCIEQHEITSGKGVIAVSDMNFEFFWEQLLLALTAAEETSTIEVQQNDYKLKTEVI
ncbi:HFL167Cp [Eremothecium sinecaudum]|uniref:HFL167Cp n=1 Tax=Eremothecium sinecaudum TaxID=45286 RepID=A0A0X8HUE8_9SACH|nr:HFL167Cp [Eremothecium sinecaudum]AMD21689.1 HFL167Cp [Eremothecium sinecaudum]